MMGRALLMGGTALIGLMASTVHAHSALIRAEPGSRATLTESPKVIRLWFNEPVEAAFSKVMLEKADGKALTGVGVPKAAPDDAKQLIIQLPILAPGTYRVRYHVLSVDGHVVDWGYGFRVVPAKPSP